MRSGYEYVREQGQYPRGSPECTERPKKRANLSNFLLRSHDLKTNDSLRQFQESYSDFL